MKDVAVAFIKAAKPNFRLISRIIEAYFNADKLGIVSIMPLDNKAPKVDTAIVTDISTDSLTFVCRDLECSLFKPGHKIAVLVDLKSEHERAKAKGKGKVRKVICDEKECEVIVDMDFPIKDRKAIVKFTSNKILRELPSYYFR